MSDLIKFLPSNNNNTNIRQETITNSIPTKHMGNCCRGQFSTPVMEGGDRRAPPWKNHRERRHGGSRCCSSTTNKDSKEGNLREVKIRMTKKELEELVGWLNMADSSFEHVMARLVNVISDQNGENNDQMVQLRQQCSWRPSLQSIPEII